MDHARGRRPRQRTVRPLAWRASAQWPGLFESKAIAEEGFIYGLPIVMNYAVMYAYAVDKNSGQFKAPFNQIFNEARVFTDKDTAIVTPNSDTPYSFLWMDLRAEPLVLSVPAVEKSRYYAVQLEDGNTFNFGYIGSRATGNEAGDYMVVGPNWNGATPPGLKQVFRSSTQFAIAGYRTQLFNAADMPNVVKVQAGYRVQPLSAYLKQPAPPVAPVINFPKIDQELVKTNFFEYLDFSLQFAPPGPEEQEIRAKLERLGIGPGKTFDFKDLSLEHKAEVALGMKEGEAKVTQAADHLGKDINGWKVSSPFGDRAFFHGDWLLRAAGAKAGIYGNDAVEATYPITKTLANGEVLDSSKHNYTLTFAQDQFPPVNAFWSVTMYDGKTQFLIKNPIDRYLINSPMLPQLTKNADGALTLYIQNKSPGADSGVRIKLRMFGGWGWGLEELKLLGRWESNSEWAKMGYRSGVPMGGDLPAPKGKAPSFAVYAVKDPESGNLDRIQIIKGWAKNGQTFEKIYDVVWAGDRKPDPVTGAMPPIGSTVDLTKASYTNTIGAVELKTVWTDPDFDPSLDAFYYARVLEIPTPRWTTIQAAELGQVPPSVVAATVQERAWSSPIWFTPTAEGRKSAAPGTTVADLKAKGAVALTDAQLKDLVVSKTVTARNMVTGQRFEILYGSTGRRMIVSIDGKQPEPGDLFHPNHQMEAGSPAPYEIKDGQIVTTLDNMPFAVTVYKVDNKYIAARSNEFGYANYEIVEVKL